MHDIGYVLALCASSSIDELKASQLYTSETWDDHITGVILKEVDESLDNVIISKLNIHWIIVFRRYVFPVGITSCFQTIPLLRGIIKLLMSNEKPDSFSLGVGGNGVVKNPKSYETLIYIRYSTIATISDQMIVKLQPLITQYNSITA